MMDLAAEPLSGFGYSARQLNIVVRLCRCGSGAYSLLTDKSVYRYRGTLYDTGADS
jgi:hypothetical protein